MNQIGVLSVTEGDGHGAEIVLLELLKGWGNGPQMTTIIAPVGSSIFQAAQFHGYQTLAWPASSDSFKENFKAALKLRSQLKDLSVIHGWTARTFDLVRLLRSSKAQKLTATLHDHPEAHFHGQFRRKVMKYSANGLDGLVAVSEAVCEACKSCGYQVPISVHHNGLSETDWVQDFQNRSVKKEVLDVAFLGMYSTGKGFDLIEKLASEESVSKKFNWHLYGNVIPILQSRAEKLIQMNNQVYLHGKKAIDTIYGNADIVLHASTAFDSLPTVLMEAGRSGLCSVASNLGGSPEIVIDKETGFLFDPNDFQQLLSCFQMLNENPDLLSAYGNAARERWVQEFQVSKMVQRYQSYWTDLLSP